MNIVEIVEVVVWPVVALILGLLGLWYLFVRGGNVIVEIAGNRITISSAEAGQKLSKLFTEFNKVYDDLLKENQKQFFRQVRAHRGTPMVKEMFPDFDHENQEQIGTLRALRGLGLIAPAEGGNWQRESHIVVTDFGKVLTTYFPEKS